MPANTSLDIVALTRYGRLGASSRVRFLQYLPYLQRCGFRVRVEPLLPDSYIHSLQTGSRPLGQVMNAYYQRLSSLWASKRPGLFWIEKEAFPWLPAGLELATLGRSARIVVDYDDAVFHQYDQHPRRLVKALLGGKHVYLMRRAEYVIAGNRYIADYARQAGARHVVELPSVVDLHRYSLADQVSDTAAASTTGPADNEACVRVGWIGQRSTAVFLKPLASVFEELSREGKLRFTAVGINAPDLGLPMDSTAWTEETEVAEIRRFDIGIMPLADGPFERGKCGYKLIQYMACGLPVIASPVGINNQIVTHGVNGYLASTAEEWAAALRALAADASLRARMGKAGRRLVEDHYSLQSAAPRLAEFLRVAWAGT